MSKRVPVLLTALIFLWASLIAPARAIIPPPLVVAAVTLADEAVILAAGAALGTITAAAYKYLTLKDNQTGQTIRVPLTSDPAKAPPAPAATATTQPAMGTQFYVNNPLCMSQGIYTSDADSACSQCVSANGQIDPHIYAGNQCRCYYAGHSGEPAYECAVGNIYTQQALQCPTGYQLNGTLCVLTDAREAQPDANNDYFRDGDSFAPAAANDADKASAPPHSNSGGTVAVSGRTLSGEPTQTIVKPLIGGGSQVIMQTQRNGMVEQQTITFDAAGNVLSFTSTQAPGQMIYDTATGTSSINGQEPIYNPDGTSSSVPPATLNVQFPDDYNREVTQQQIRDKLVNSQEVNDPGEPQVQQFTDSFFKDTFTELLAWDLPSHSSTCPVGSFFWNNSTYTVDAHCQLINEHWTLLTQAMAVVWIISALFIVMRA